MEFLNSADAYYKVVYYIALGSFAVFTIQSLLTFFGGDFHDGTEADFNGDIAGHNSTFQYFTFRNLINFLLGFSWTAAALHSAIENKVIVSLVATGVGVSLVYLVLKMMKEFSRMTQDNTMRLEQAIGKSAEVYLTIPANKSGKGKVHISLQHTLRELDALTEGEAIPSGANVTVIALFENSTLLVVKS